MRVLQVFQSIEFGIHQLCFIQRIPSTLSVLRVISSMSTMGNLQTGVVFVIVVQNFVYVLQGSPLTSQSPSPKICLLALCGYFSTWKCIRDYCGMV